MAGGGEEELKLELKLGQECGKHVSFGLGLERNWGWVWVCAEAQEVGELRPRPPCRKGLLDGKS